MYVHLSKPIVLQRSCHPLIDDATICKNALHLQIRFSVRVSYVSLADQTDCLPEIMPPLIDNAAIRMYDSPSALSESISDFKNAIASTYMISGQQSLYVPI